MKTLVRIVFEKFIWMRVPIAIPFVLYCLHTIAHNSMLYTSIHFQHAGREARYNAHKLKLWLDECNFNFTTHKYSFIPFVFLLSK